MKFLNRRSLLLAISFLLILTNGPTLLSHYQQAFLGASRSSSYFAHDEPATVASALKTAEKGYWEFRCLEAPWTYCYGGLMPLLDAVLLRTYDNILRPTNQSPPGRVWPWLAPNSEVRTFLRQTRLWISLALISLVFVYALPLGFLPATWIGIGFGLTDQFLFSWRGIKNDYVSALFFGFFLLTIWTYAKARFETPRWLYLCLSLFFGILSFSARASTLPLIGWIIAGVVLFEMINSKNRFSTLLKSMGLCVLGLFVYLTVNPNTFHSSGEAKWLVIPFTVGGMPWDIKKFWIELPHAAWGFLPLLAVWSFLPKERSLREKWVDRLMISSFALLTFTLLKAGINSITQAQYYYLTHLLTTVLLALRTTKSTHSLKPAFFLIGFLAIATWKSLPLPFDPNHLDLWAQETQMKSKVDSAFQQKKRLWVDLNTRASVPVSEGDSTVWFDSQTQSPWEVISLMDEDVKKYQQPVALLVSCWSTESSSSAGNWIQQAADWSKVTHHYCPEAHPLTFTITHPYMEGFRATQTVLLPYDTLRYAVSKLSPTAIPSDVTVIQPRTMKGSEWGSDQFSGEFRFNQSWNLEGKYQFAKPIHSLDLFLESTCKNPSQISASANGTEHQVSADVTEKNLNYFSELIGRKWIDLPVIKRWISSSYFNRSFDLEPIRFHWKTPVTQLTLQLKSVHPNEECSTSIRSIQVKYRDSK
jgi:hypothetical protein